MSHVLDNAHLEELAVLSLAQQRLWSLEQGIEGRPLYNIPFVLRLEGTLDRHALERALHEIVQRHEVLRTIFVRVHGRPMQSILPTLQVPLPRTDLTSVPAHEREAIALRLVKMEARRPFDLEKGPLVRAWLIQLDITMSVFSLTLHHIVADSRTLGILMHELTILYTAFIRGEPSSLPPLPMQYRDFAVQQYAQKAMLAERLAYWKRQLGPEVPVLELLTDHPRPVVRRYRGSLVTSQLSTELSRCIISLSQQEGVTLYMIVLAAFQTLLYRYTGQTDIAVGSATINHDQVEIDQLIGCFVNMLVLQVDLSGNPSFRALLQRVRKVTLGAYAHQDIPFDELIKALQPESDSSRSPLFQVVLSMQNVSPPMFTLPGLIATPLAVDLGIARFDMSVIVTEKPHAGLCFEVEYRTDLFEAATIQRMLGHLEILLQAIVNNPEEHLAELPILTSFEREQLLYTWNATKHRYPDTSTIPTLFSAQVVHTPKAVAVSFEGQQLTYAELDTQTNHLAHYLHSMGVGPEVLVGLCMERSFEMIIGILGILKAGGAYVPLDPNYPVERLAFVLHDTQIRLLLTQERLLVHLPSHDAQVVCLDRDWPTSAAQATTMPISGVQPDNLAYVIYTSGSTGTPKGTLLTHRAVSNFTASTIRLFEVTQRDHILQFANFCFDVSIFEIFTALLSGAELCLTTYETIVSPRALTTFMLQHEISIIDIPPVVLNLLPGERFSALRIALIGGESFSSELVSNWERPGRRFFNGYGPTESTVTVTLMECVGDFEQSPPIGRPMPNHRVYVLDREGQPVPVNVPGQLYIGGAGLARGYLKLPHLTAEKFVPDAFSGQSGARLYATGDLVRYLPDGNLEFLGRIDQQVKFRGFRIELGEIEAVLSQYPAIQQAIVLVQQKQGEEKRLVAYICPVHDEVPAENKLRQWLKERLPVYMLPTVYVMLEQFPMTASGKVNRAALPIPDRRRSGMDESYKAPRTQIEQVLAREVFSKILGIAHVGIHDSFFELGGNSLQTTQLSSRLQEVFQVELPVRTFFEASTIADLATIIQASQQQQFGFQDGSSASLPSDWSPLVLLQKGTISPPLFCVHPSGGTVSCYTTLTRSLRIDRPIYGIEAYGLEKDQEPLMEIEELAAMYVTALQTVQPAGPYLLIGWSIGGLIAFEMAQQLHTQGEAVALLGVLDTTIPPANSPALDDADLAEQFIYNFARAFGASVPSMQRSTSATSLQWIVEAVKHIDIGSARIDNAELERHFNVFKTLVRAARQYIPHAYSGSITLLRAFESSDMSETWSRLVTGSLDIQLVPGDHYTFLQEPLVQSLSEQLRQLITHVLPAYEEASIDQ